MIVAAVSFVFSGLYSGSETAFIAADRIRLQHLAARGDRRARKVLVLLNDPGYLMSALLVGTNLSVIACTTAFTAIATARWGASGAGLATLILVPSMLIFAEIIPKGLFLYYASRAALLSVDALTAATRLLKPLVWVFSELARVCVRALPDLEVEGVSPGIKQADVLYHIADSREAGLISPQTNALVDRALSLQHLSIRDVLRPLGEVAMIDADAPAESYAAAFARHGYSRMPLYRGERSNVVAVMSANDFMHAPDVVRLRDALPAAEVFPADTPLVDILVTMREQGCHMVFVRENGTIVGMTTLEDILERFVGAIADEFH